MNQFRTFAAFLVAFILGTVMTTLISGCQQAEPPYTSGSTSSNTTIPADPPVATENKTADEPAATAPTIEKGTDASPAPVEPTTEPKSTTTPAPSTEPKSETAPPTSEPKASDSKEPDSKPADTKTEQPESKSESKADSAKADAVKTDAVKTEAKVAGKATTVPAIDKSANAKIVAGDWDQWGGSGYRNNTPIAENIPTEWKLGEIDRKTGAWKKEGSKNIRWVSRVGSQTYGNPVIAADRVYVGTNNTGGYLARYPSDVDLGVLLAFTEKDGSFLWVVGGIERTRGR